MRISGKNIGESELEATVESSHPAVCGGSTSVFAARQAPADGLVVIAEVERRSGGDRRARDVPPRDALESFWFEERGRPDRRAGGLPFASIDDDEVAAAIRDAVRMHHEIEVRKVLLVPPGSLPRAADGRIDREGCRARFLPPSEDEA